MEDRQVYFRLVSFAPLVFSLILVPLAHTVGFMRPGCHEPTWQQRYRSDRIPILSIDNRQIFKNGLPFVHFSGGERIHKLRVGILGWIPCRGR